MPPDIRWRVVRTLLRIEDLAKLTEIRHQLRECADSVWTSLGWKVKSRLQMAMKSIQRLVRVRGYVVVKGKGAHTMEELETAGYNVEKLDKVIPDPDFYPMVEFHVHPKMSDLKFLSDLRKAGINHAVLLATDTDPADVDRPEIIESSG